MNNIVSLITYTANAVDDIEKAIRERLINTRDVPLAEYGDLIRSIKADTVTEPLPLAIVFRTKKKPKIITKSIIHDFTLIPYYIEGYEPISSSSQNNNSTEEEI